MWTVWDKQTDINGVSAEEYLAENKHLQNEETIYIKTAIVEVEGKNTLASVYGIDETLSNEEFIAEYERVIAEPAEETETAE